MSILTGKNPLLNKKIALLLLISLGLRICYIGFTPGHIPQGDAKQYYQYAYANVSNTNLSFNFYYPPLQTILLSAALKAGSATVTGARVVQAVISSISTIIIYLLACRISSSKWMPFVTALISIFYFDLFIISTTLYHEPLYLFLLLALALGVSELLRQQLWLTWIVTGVVLGLLVLTRNSFTFFIPFLFFFLFWATTIPVRKKLVGLLLIILSAAAIIAPFPLYTRMVTGNMFIAQNSWSNIYAGNSPGSPYYYNNVRHVKNLNPPRNLTLREQYYKGLAIDYLITHKLTFIKRTAIRFLRFWSFFLDYNANIISHADNPVKQLLRTFSPGVFFYFFLPGFIWQLGCLRRDNKLQLFLLIFISYTVSGFSAVFVHLRFRMHILPFFIIFATLGYQHFWQNVIIAATKSARKVFSKQIAIVTAVYIGLICFSIFDYFFLIS